MDMGEKFKSEMDNYVMSELKRRVDAGESTVKISHTKQMSENELEFLRQARMIRCNQCEK